MVIGYVYEGYIIYSHTICSMDIDKASTSLENALKEILLRAIDKPES